MPMIAQQKYLWPYWESQKCRIHSLNFIAKFKYEGTVENIFYYFPCYSVQWVYRSTYSKLLVLAGYNFSEFVHNTKFEQKDKINKPQTVTNIFSCLLYDIWSGYKNINVLYCHLFNRNWPNNTPEIEDIMNWWYKELVPGWSFMVNGSYNYYDVFY